MALQQFKKKKSQLGLRMDIKKVFLRFNYKYRQALKNPCV